MSCLSFKVCVPTAARGSQTLDFWNGSFSDNFKERKQYNLQLLSTSEHF